VDENVCHDGILTKFKHLEEVLLPSLEQIRDLPYDKKRRWGLDARIFFEIQRNISGKLCKKTSP
jgi:hypothetical protein